MERQIKSAPIVLFVFKRLDHVTQVVEALKKAPSYNLTAVDGTRRKIGAWELYALVFGAEAFIRLILPIEGETFKVLPLNRKFAVSNYGRVFSTCEAKLRELKP